MQYGGQHGQGGYGQGGYDQGGRQNRRLVMIETRKSYTNNWATDLMGAPCANPGFCLYAACCQTCVAYQQRKEIMFNDLTNYTCCNGDMCISGRCGERKCPEFCLVMEVCCCFPSAVATNRFMIQDEQRVMNTECDNCLIGFMLCMNQLACIFRIAAMISGSDTLEEAANLLDCIADVTYAACAPACRPAPGQLKMRTPTRGRRPGTTSRAQVIHLHPARSPRARHFQHAPGRQPPPHGGTPSPRAQYGLPSPRPSTATLSRPRREVRLLSAAPASGRRDGTKREEREV